MMNPLSKTHLLGLSLAGLLFASCSTRETVVADYQVVPMPLEITTAQQASYLLKNGAVVYYPAGNEMMRRNAEFLAAYVKEQTGLELKLQEGDGGKNGITLKLGLAGENKEGYQLKVNADGVTIAAPSEAGVFYGIQTLRKSIDVAQGANIELPAVEINDEPRFSYRGMHLDVSRHFFTVDEVKTFIDMLALHNINRFHWHLTDDQGWRIEIKKYPKLTEIGSKRSETVIGRNSGKYDGKPYGGFYTQEDAREIIAYAAERYITVIPEIDLPGHRQAALAAYPELGCTGGPYEVATQFGVFTDVLCGGNEKSLQFAKDVLNEIMDIFPSPYIHIGGDECPKERWEACPKCQAQIRKLGLKDTPEHSKENQLQAWFMGEVEKSIVARGRKMLAWDEILEGNPAKSTTVMAWTSPNVRIKSARLGHNTIVCPITHLYFSNPGYNRLKGVSSVARVYNFEPVADELTPEEKARIIGVQGCIWTEWTKDSVKMEWQMMPRIAALSELQWSNPKQKNLDNFLGRLRHQLDLYILYGYHYKQDIDNVTIDINAGENGQALVTLSTFDNAPVFYTTDGSEPTASSAAYTEPFPVQGSQTIKAKAIRNGRESETTEETLNYSLATMRPITLASEADKGYTFKGATLLNDGLKGDGNYRSGRYMGFYSNNVDATIDLQSEQEISEAFIDTYLVPGDYIFGLTGMEVYVSNDGKSFSKVASRQIPVLEKGSKNNVPCHNTLAFDKTKARYVRIVGKCTPTLPAWHSGAGKKAFLYEDEIGVK